MVDMVANKRRHPVSDGEMLGKMACSRCDAKDITQCDHAKALKQVSASVHVAPYRRS